MVQQLNIYLLSFGALQGAVLSFFLLRKRRNDAARTFFALFLIVIGLQLTFKVFTKSWLWYNVNLLYLLSYSLPLLIGPSLYLFFRSREGKVPVTKSDLLHAIPFVLHLTNTLTGEVFGFYIIPGYIFGLPFPSYDLISIYAYCFASWRITHGELRRFIVVVMIVETVILFTIMLMIQNNPDFPDMRWLFITLTLLVYWISYKIFESPDLFAKYQRPASLMHEVTVKYAHSGLKAEEADRIEVLVRDSIYKENVFLDPAFSVEVFAKKLQVSRHHLSRVINERFGKSFNDLANGWRLEEARARLIDPKYQDLTISTIAYDCGFSSVSSFNTMFRRKFKTTPSEWRVRTLPSRGFPLASSGE